MPTSVGSLLTMAAWSEPLFVGQLVVMGFGYGALSLVHSVLQRRYARQEMGEVHYERLTIAGATSPPSIDLIVPCWNENPDRLAACADSLLVAAEKYPGVVKVYLIDDGSDNADELSWVYERYEDENGWSVTKLGENRGKRSAQGSAVRNAYGEIVVTVDSDTVVSPDALCLIVEPFRDDHIGAVAGNVEPWNGTNWFSRLLRERYRLVFDGERAAQSRFDSVACCAGPFAAYRRSAIDGVWDRYVEQRFLGARCVSGDDLHLTILVLAQGYGARYEPRAVARTYVPTTLCTYFCQQVRWNGSFYRELGQIIRVLPRLHGFLTLDTAARTLLPMLLSIQFGLVLKDIVFDQAHLLWDAAIAAAMTLVSAGLALRNSPKKFVLLYGLLYVTLLLPARLWALVTIRNAGWRVRKVCRAPLPELHNAPF